MSFFLVERSQYMFLKEFQNQESQICLELQPATMSISTALINNHSLIGTTIKNGPCE